MSEFPQPAEPKPAEGSKRPGRVTHDSRGNAVWDWAIATGVLATATIQDLLQALAPPERVTIELESGPSTRFAGDPYNRSAFRMGGRRR
jgi:hypothetical protein